MKFGSYALLFLVFGCSAPSTTPSETTAALAAPATVATAPAPELAVIQEVTEQHLFSDRTKADQFRLQLVGDAALTGTVHLSIVSATGKTIWSDQFPAKALLDIGFDAYGSDHPTDAQRIAYIQKRLKEFFVAENFRDQAVKATDKFDPDYSADRKGWEEAKQTKLPGFFYNIGEEHGRQLAYSPSQQKAVVVQSCC